MGIVSKPGSPYRVLDFGQVQIQMQVAQPTDENFLAHLDAETQRMNGYLRSRDRVVPHKAVVIHAPSCDLIPKASIRRLQAEWIIRNEHVLKIMCHSLAIIVPGTIVRNAVTAALWLAPMPVPMKVHRDMDAAVEWAIREADSIGGQVDSELRLGRCAAHPSL